MVQQTELPRFNREPMKCKHQKGKQMALQVCPALSQVSARAKSEWDFISEHGEYCLKAAGSVGLIRVCECRQWLTIPLLW